MRDCDRKIKRFNQSAKSLNKRRMKEWVDRIPSIHHSYHMTHEWCLSCSWRSKNEERRNRIRWLKQSNKRKKSTTLAYKINRSFTLIIMVFFVVERNSHFERDEATNRFVSLVRETVPHIFDKFLHTTFRYSLTFFQTCMFIELNWRLRECARETLLENWSEWSSFPVPHMNTVRAVNRFRYSYCIVWSKFSSMWSSTPLFVVLPQSTRHLFFLNLS
jgi:hypothetical protein